ncbi:pyroglutamyl-peptidase I [Pseudoalteromonas sp. T1lg65]|uniref:pyroglutamyl-peptidase I n=1 Tax=Pseudoalteromonas sp. T1lg65 TaxID=2077101 RepID=UPI003F7A5075
MAKHSKPCVLLTGFTPFDGEAVNPSWLAAQALDGQTIEGHVVHAKELPCEFNHSLNTLYKTIDKYAPTVVICLGQAGGRSDISLERVAININDARIPDNKGFQPIDTPVIAGGDDAYFATLPIKAMLQKLHQAHIPASVSNTAGTYVCNHVMYGLLHYIKSHELNCRGGFVHIPFSPLQAVNHSGAASMSLASVIEAIKVMITCAVTEQHDIKLSAGTTH